MIADTPVDFGCEPGDIAVGTGYQLANAGVVPVQIEPLSVSGYQFVFTGGGAMIWVSCISTTTPVALAAPATAAGRVTGRSAASQPTGLSSRSATVEEEN